MGMLKHIHHPHLMPILFPVNWLVEEKYVTTHPSARTSLASLHSMKNKVKLT